MMALWLLACAGDANSIPSAEAEPGQGPPFRFELTASVPQPTAIAEPAAGPAGLWVSEQEGRLHRLDGRKPRVALDITDRVASGGETGLLGFAFHPGWPGEPRVFVNYTTRDAGKLQTVVASFRSDDGGLSLNASSEAEVLRFDQPWSNHNSGPIQFGTDGMLYIAVGDGGSGGDPRRTGQNPSDWLGSILRVDVAVRPYRVPADNPFLGRDGFAPELWAYGLRNPWGMHFDGSTLWFADVGQSSWEEVNRGVAGGNYGWPVREGLHCYGKEPCPTGFVEPLAEYGRDLGASVTGGLVVRDPALPALQDRYLFADFATGTFFSIPQEGGTPVVAGRTKLNPSTFGTDRKRQVYVGDYASGRILRLAAPTSPAPTPAATAPSR